MLTAERLTVRAGNRALVDAIDLELRQREVLAVLGANGAGKTTLLRAMAGALRPASGRVRFCGRDLADWRPGDLACRRAVLSQSTALAFPFTALEVALLGRLPHSPRGESARDTIVARAALDLAGVGDMAERRYHTLSGGEQQRVQLARVLAQVWGARPDSPHAVLLDEPTASLDMAQQQRTLETVGRLAREGAGVLVILHDPNLAAVYADRIAVLARGRLVCVGPPREALTVEVFAEAFGAQVVVAAHPRGDVPLVIPCVQQTRRSHDDEGARIHEG